MSEKLKPETQHQRWIKYGANVALTILVVIVLAALITYLAQRSSRRIDTTASGAYSLKPQTINIIKDLKSPVRIVSLYSKPTNPNVKEDTDFGQAVSDLLQEYARKGKNIEVQMIDPIADPSKADALYDEVRDRYGGELAKYKTFLESVPAQFDQISKLATEEQEKVRAVPEQTGDAELDETMGQIKRTLQSVVSLISERQERIARLLKAKRPDYKLATDLVEGPAQGISDYVAQIESRLLPAKDKPGVAPAVKQYIADSAPRFAQIKKISDEVLDKFKKLGELKLDEVQQKLRERDAVLVMGDKEMRSLSFDQLWQPDTTMKKWGADEKMKPRFAGEQQVTTAILSLTDAGKKKVVFIRPSGPPLTNPGFLGIQAGGPFSAVADRLRDYNFEVVEKDLSGQYAMQAQMQGMPAPPEPSDEELKDAVWIVLNIPAGDSRMGPAPHIGPRLAEHLKNGGSAMVVTYPRADDLADALKEWGVQNHPDTVAAHEVPKTTGAPPTDLAESVQRSPHVFVVNRFGDHMLTSPMQSLDMVLAQLCPVTTTSTAGVKATPMIRLPDSPPCWGERDIASMGQDIPTFSKDSDMPPPLWAAAAVEKTGGGRLVLFGSLPALSNEAVQFPDIEASKAQRRLILRFPGNAEFFANSVFWLANRETLIAISPQAMDVPRIAQMSPGMQNFWRVGLLLIVLPGLVIASGLMVYFARRD